MTNTFFMRKKFRAGTALQALALLGAGIGASAAFVAPASAQDYTNINATGRVQGTDGQPIAGAKVMLLSDDTGLQRSVTTSSAGTFTVAQIPPGSYTFTVTADGYDTYTEGHIDLTRAAAGNQFTLAPTGTTAAGDIVVTAGRVRVADFDQTTSGAVISIGDLAKRVPVARSLRDVILLAPGTVQGGSAQNSAFAGQATISGSTFSENAYYVNGLNITEFRQGFSPVAIPFDFYDTVEVKTGGFSAEFGRATGGVVNATTKSGSNEFHASMLFNFEPDALTGDAPNTYAADNDDDYHQRTDTVFQISGPVIKDHLFFYGLANFRDVKDRSSGATSGQSTISRTQSPFFGGKLDAFWWGQHLEFTYFDTTSAQHNRTFTYDPDTNTRGDFIAGSTSRGGGENYVGRYTGTITDFLTISAAYGVNKNRAGSLPLDTVNPRVTDDRDPANSKELGNTSTSITTDDDKREFYRGDVDLNFHLLGSHHVRFGYDHEKLTSVHVSTPIGGGYYDILTALAGNTFGVPAGTAYVTRRFFKNGGTFNTINEAYYAEDSWSLWHDRLTLNLGIRNDRFDNKGAGGDSFYTSGNQWGPRLGFTLDPLGTGRSKIYGTFGRYFLPIAGNTNIRGAGSETDYTSFNVLGGLGPHNVPILGAPLTPPNAQSCPDTGTVNCQVTSNGEVADPTSFQAKGLKPQSEDEYTLGFEQRLGQHWRISAAYTYRTLNRALEDAAIDQAALAYCHAQGFADDPNAGTPQQNPALLGCNEIYTGFSQYVLVNPGEDASITLSGNGGIGLPDGTNPVVNFTAAQLGYPKATRKYQAMTFTVDREFDGKWSFNASYTLAADIGNYEGGVKSDIGQSDTGATEDFDQPGFTYGIYGYLPNHRRHTIKLYGSYQLTDWLLLGANAVIQSPKKFGCIGVVPISVDPFAAQYRGGSFFCANADDPTQSHLVPRGSAFQSDWRKELDLTVQVNLPVDFDASLRFDVFNVLNDKSKLDFDEIGDLDYQVINPHYGDPLVYQAARSARVQLRIGF